MGTPKEWRPIVEALSTTYRCITVTWPGHDGQPLPSTPLHFSNLSRSLLDTLDKHALLPCVWVGYSMGGRLALYTATQSPASCTRLIIESSQPGLDNPVERQTRASIDTKRAQTIIEKGLPAFLKTWYQAPLFQSMQRDHTLMKQLSVWRQQQQKEHMARIIEELSPGRQPSCWSSLPSLSMPVHLLCGQLDTKYTSLMQEMQRALPHATLCSLPDAGHNTHLEQPHAFLRALQSALRA